MPVYTDNWPSVWQPAWGAPSGGVTSDSGFAPNFPPDFIYHTVVTRTPQTERARWTFFSRDGNRQLTSQIADFQDSVITIRAGAVGAWTMTLPRDDLSAALLLKPKAGIVAMRDGVIVFSGQVRTRRRALDKDRRTLVVSGPDDLGLLQDRLVKTQPQTPLIPYATADFDSRSGKASTVMFDYVANDAGPLATIDRRVPGLVLGVDELLGSNITVNGRWQTLDKILAYCGAASVPELLFRCVQTGNEQVQFDVTRSLDLSHQVVFAETLGNLLTYNISETALGNHVVVGGAGTLRNRNILEGDDSGAAIDWGRIEVFDNEGSAQSLLDMSNALNAGLLTNATQWSIELGLSDDAIARWGTTYDVGDTVTVVLEGVPFTEVIREIQVGFGKDGDGNDVANVVPFIETNGGRETRTGNKLVSSVRQVQDAVNKLETIG